MVNALEAAARFGSRTLLALLVLALLGCSQGGPPEIGTRSTKIVTPLRMQAGFPTLTADPDSSLATALALLNDPFVRWAELVEQMTDGAIQIDILPCCTTASTGVVHQEVSKGVLLDGAQGIAAYLYNTSSALRRTAGLFDGAWSDLDTAHMLQWIELGGGRELYAELMQKLGYHVVIIQFGAVPPQNLGWFPHHLNGPADLVGLRYRTAGMANEMIAQLGMVPTAVGAGALVTALQVGTIDAAEFNTPGNDLALGLHKAVRPGCTASPADDCRFTYYVGGLGQKAEWFDIILNADVYNSLSADQQQIMHAAAQIADAEFRDRIARVDAESLTVLHRKKTKVHQVPGNIVQAERAAWAAVTACPVNQPEYDLFCRVKASMKKWVSEHADDEQ